MGGRTTQQLCRPPATRFFARLVKGTTSLLIFSVFAAAKMASAEFAFAGESVDRGFSVLVFRGRADEDGRLGKFQTGIRLLATGCRPSPAG
jgi:hypothetical protein